MAKITKNDLVKPFAVIKWKWYLINLTDFHQPAIIKKHLDYKQQALELKERSYDKNYEVVDGKTVLKYDLKTRKEHYTELKKIPTKYEYPPNYKTQIERSIYRNNQRKRMKQQKRLPEVTNRVVYEILEDKPMLFIRRMKIYKKNHFPYSEPVPGVRTLKKKFIWPTEVRHHCNIIRVLRRYYDTGPYDLVHLAIFIYEKWGKRIEKYANKFKANPSNMSRIIAEFKARGFVEKSTLKLDPNEDSWIETIHIYPVLAHPTLCWHNFKDQGIYDDWVYDFQAKMGIPGYTKACPAGLARRR